jgi:hypothetical protein
MLALSSWHVSKLLLDFSGNRAARDMNAELSTENKKKKVVNHIF